MGLVWTEGKNREKRVANLKCRRPLRGDGGREREIERQRAERGGGEGRGGVSLISVHVCYAVFLQGFLVSFSRHHRVHSLGSDANGSVKGAYALWPG